MKLKLNKSCRALLIVFLLCFQQLVSASDSSSKITYFVTGAFLSGMVTSIGWYFYHQKVLKKERAIYSGYRNSLQEGSERVFLSLDNVIAEKDKHIKILKKIEKNLRQELRKGRIRLED